MTTDVWSYAGKRVVIAGCYSGMGEATARELVRLGAEVHGVDIKRSPVDLASFREVDLRDTAQIDAALEANDPGMLIQKALRRCLHFLEDVHPGPFHEDGSAPHQAGNPHQHPLDGMS